MNLSITKEAAKAAYDKADKKGKELLEILLGKENFIPVNIMEQVKTFEDACVALGIHPTDAGVSIAASAMADEQKALNAFVKLVLIAKVLNQGWIPDWNNSNQYKYYPYFDMRSTAGFGFSYTFCGRDYSNAGVGSRLCFKSRELAEYAGKQFENIYKDLYTL